MKKHLLMALVLSLSLGAFAVPTASAHVCNDGSSCDGQNCPEDGHHIHRNNGHSCLAIDLQFVLADNLGISHAPGTWTGDLPVELQPLIEPNELFLGLA